MPAELHCHSKISDGTASVGEIVALAKATGLSALSVTDHDTLEGSDKAAEYGGRLGVRIVTGTEISCFDYERQRNVHLLCYLPHNRERLCALLESVREGRSRAVEESARRVTELYPITHEMIERRAEGSSTLFKQHIMHALMDAGYAGEVFGSEFRELFGKGGKARVTFEHPDIFEALDIVRGSGAVAVLAHPAVYDSYEIIPELIRRGLDGIEVSYPRARSDDAETLGALCRRHGLIMTGGTDFHGSNCTAPHPLGTCTTSDEQLERLIALAQSRGQ